MVAERFMTFSTNAILEQKGAVTGILMTGGFEDALEIGRQKRSNLQGLRPAIIAQPDTTAVVYPGYPCHVDTAGSLLLTSTAH